MIFIQGAFKNIQGILWKTQGILKDVAHVFIFQGLFQGHDAFSRSFSRPV